MANNLHRGLGDRRRGRARILAKLPKIVQLGGAIGSKYGSPLFLPDLRSSPDFSASEVLLKSLSQRAEGSSMSDDDEGKKDEENNKAPEPQKPTGKRSSGLVASSKEDRGPWLGLAQLARN
jgi:hypothetical protein